jgi:hypothetical protein
MLAATSLFAADPPLRGHWTGTMSVPGDPVDFEVDFDNPGSNWVGSISIPSRRASGIPLEGVALADGKWTFRIKGSPGLPTFTGKISDDGQNMAGDFVAGGKPVPFKITRAGDPHVVLPKASPAVPDKFVGEWDGGIEAVALRLRLSLKLSNGPDGAHAVLSSEDQGGSEIPVASIEHTDNGITLRVTAVGADMIAEIDAEGKTLNGAWRQAGKSLPVILKKK